VKQTVVRQTYVGVKFSSLNLTTQEPRKHFLDVRLMLKAELIKLELKTEKKF
jgi:hypothetical protein